MTDRLVKGEKVMTAKATSKYSDDWEVVTHLSLIYRWIVSNLSDFVSGESLNYKVSFDQFLIMYEISTNENLTGSKLAKTMSVSRSAISRQCRLLKENGYVVEEHLQTDQRVKFLSLTKQGQDVLDRLVSRYVEKYREIETQMGRDKVDGLIQFIDQFYLDVIEPSEYQDNKMGRSFLNKVKKMNEESAE